MLDFLLKQSPALQGTETQTPLLYSASCFHPLVFPEKRGGPEDLRQGRTSKAVVTDIFDQLCNAWMARAGYKSSSCHFPGCVADTSLLAEPLGQTKD